MKDLRITNLVITATKKNVLICNMSARPENLQGDLFINVLLRYDIIVIIIIIFIHTSLINWNKKSSGMSVPIGKGSEDTIYLYTLLLADD